MFREMRRFKQALPAAECADILRREKRGVLAVAGDGGYPYALPINFYYEESENKIYFHCAREGHKRDAMAACDKVCFTVFEQGEQRGDWSYFVRSVIVFGRAKPVADLAVKRQKAKLFGMKYYPDEASVEVELQKDFARVEIMEIAVEHMTGKLVHEK